ncbi:hypothetical protein ACIRJO_41285 [Streptomyces sp. NPDC102394]|uniref:hypothetical protein n=1 Tax=Streptomyces sp. NPDC102394 TaxID=3366167 RepID=UPI00380B80C1
MISTTTPVTDVDLFEDEVLNDAYPVWEELRELGAAVHLSRHGCWVPPRYAQVRAAWSDHGRFSSVESVVLEAGSQRAASRRGSRLRPARARRAERCSVGEPGGARPRPTADGRRQSFDVVRDLARVFPVRVAADLIGRPLAAGEEVGEHRVAPLLWAYLAASMDTTVNAIGSGLSSAEPRVLSRPRTW